MDLSDDYLQRFGGLGRLYGTAALPRLQAAHVAVIGVGGVGSWAVELLVSRIMNRDFGYPSHPRIEMVEMQWIEGKTLRPKAD